jgi:hypothetical protein
MRRHQEDPSSSKTPYGYDVPYGCCAPQGDIMLCPQERKRRIYCLNYWILTPKDGAHVPPKMGHASPPLPQVPLGYAPAHAS